jgi:uncharacterized membrane protein YhiD involved in acid resistance
MGESMVTLFNQSFSEMSGTGLNTIILNNIVAITISLYIFMIYKFTHKGTSYSKNFNVSLGMITIVTALVMNIISNNIALSLGLVGALSIIRFRTAVKDVRDATFIFWSIAVGIASGVSMYNHAIVGSISITIFLLLMNATVRNGEYIVIVRTTGDSQSKAEAMTQKYFSNSAKLRTKNLSKEFGDLIYEIGSGHYNQSLKKNGGITLSEKLVKIEGVISIELIEQSENISK